MELLATIFAAVLAFEGGNLYNKRGTVDINHRLYNYDVAVTVAEEAPSGAVGVDKNDFGRIAVTAVSQLVGLEFGAAINQVYYTSVPDVGVLVLSITTSALQ